jgi:fibronectin-binding autotransporter adhesin
VTDFGKIYRDSTQDGPFSAWAFTATSPFDNTVAIDTLYGGNIPVAAFKFVALQLVGNPTISTLNGGANNLALISVGPITSAAAGNTVFTFTGMQSVLLATQNGSIDLAGISFQNIPLLFLYARGAGSNLTIGSPISGSLSLRLFAENNIQINAFESLQNGANGGTLVGTAGANLSVNAPIDTLTALVAAPAFTGTGGNVSLSALNGAVTVDSRIKVSYADPGAPRSGLGFRSATGGSISLSSGLTTGTGILLTANANLLSLLDAAAPGPGGSITLTTPGSDIVTNGATIQADRGTITIQQTAAATVGTAQITLNGGTIQSETLLASSRGDLTIGTTTPVNLLAVTLSLVGSNNLAWSGGTLIAAASASSGNVTLQSGNDISLTGGTDIERTNGGITSGLNLTINAGRNLQTSASLTLLTDGSGLTSGGNISINAGGTITLGGVTNLHTGPATSDQGSGSNITLTAGGPITVADLIGTVQLGAGRTLGNGGTIGLGGSSYTATLLSGGINFTVNNSAPGIIGTGGNITLNLTGGLTSGAAGPLNLTINNSNGGQIQTGGNITSSIGGNVSANQVTTQIDNRFNGFIGNGAAINFTVAGTFGTSGDSTFTILNSQAGTTGGTIGSAASINLTLGTTSIGGNLNAFIDNSDGSIGPTGNEGTVTLQINGRLSVAGRIDVFGALNATGGITAGTLSATNVSAPSISAGSGGITRFTFPNEFPVNPLHIITTNGLTSMGGINFNGPDFDPATGTGPFDGGQLTINVPSLSFGPSPADNIQGPVTFNGGSTPNATTPAGGGGTFTVNATGAITVGSSIQATSGVLPSGAEPSGAGGIVNLNSTGGPITVNSAITVSSADSAAIAPVPNPRKSRTGGNINLKSDAPAGVAINVTSTGQLLSLLDAAAPGPGGTITILATGANSRITATGPPPGGAITDSIRADRGSIDIRHTGLNGTITLTNSNILADIVKVGALGNNGVLTIGGGVINANTVLKLYAIGPNGSVNFVSNVTLNGNSIKTIAGNSVTVQNNVIVTIGGGKPADVYVLDGKLANYSNFNGGNNSTNGMFLLGGAGSPTSGAITHLGVAPPAFGPPGGP